MSKTHKQNPYSPPPPAPQEHSLTPPEVEMRVDCTQQDLATQVTEMLADARMQHVIQAAFPSPFLESFPRPPKTLQLKESRSPGPGITVRGEDATIEYNPRHVSNGQALVHIERALLTKAVIETALSGLRYFVGTSSLPDRCADDIQLFATRIKQKDALATDDVRAVVSDVIKAEYDQLLRQKDKLLKKLRENCAITGLTLDQIASRIDTARAIMRAIMAISLLIDQPGASCDQNNPRDKKDSNSRVQVVDQLASSVKSLWGNIINLWPRAIFDGNHDRAYAIIGLAREHAIQFKFEGFKAGTPLIFTVKSNSSNAPQTTQGTTRFWPAILQHNSAYLDQLFAATQYDQELRAWTTSDPVPCTQLLEELLTISQQVPAALEELRNDLPESLPIPVRKFLRTLCLLLLHGGVEGSSYFANVACHNSQEEAKITAQIRRAVTLARENKVEALTIQELGRLHTHLYKIATAHPQDYTNLVIFLAAWPLLTTQDDRRNGLEPNLGLLTALATSVVITNTNILEESFVEDIDGSFNPWELEQLGRDVHGLGEAAQALKNPQLLAYVVPITASLGNAIEVLKVELLGLPEQLTQIGRVELALKRQQDLLANAERSTSSRLPIVPTARVVHNRIKHFYDSLVDQLKQYGPTLKNQLEEFALSGDLPGFAKLTGKAIALISTLGTSDLSTELEGLIDSQVITVVNDLDESWKYDFNVNIKDITELCKDSDDQLVVRKVDDALHTATRYSAELDLLKCVFAETTPTHRNAAARVNHINGVKDNRHRQLTSALLSHPDTLLKFLRAAENLIRGHHADDQAMAVVAAERFLNLPLNLQGEKFKAIRAARDKLQRALNQRTQGRTSPSA
jgi:hypothetical protein